MEYYGRKDFKRLSKNRIKKKSGHSTFKSQNGTLKDLFCGRRTLKNNFIHGLGSPFYFFRKKEVLGVFFESIDGVWKQSTDSHF